MEVGVNLVLYSAYSYRVHKRCSLIHGPIKEEPSFRHRGCLGLALDTNTGPCKKITFLVNNLDLGIPSAVLMITLVGEGLQLQYFLFYNISMEICLLLLKLYQEHLVILKVIKV